MKLHTVILVLVGGLAAVPTAYGLIPQRASRPFLTAPVERGEIASYVSVTGRLKPVIEVEVGSQLSGQIADLTADFNDVVAQGQPLARLDSQTYEARLRAAAAELEIAEAQVLMKEASVQRAQAQLTNARASLGVAKAKLESRHAVADAATRELRRVEAMQRDNAVAGMMVDAARTGFKTAAADLRADEQQLSVHEASIRSAEAALAIAIADVENARALVRQKAAQHDQAKVDLERTVIKAPIDGLVVSRDVNLGQTVAASLEAPKLFVLAGNLDEMEVHARVDEADIGRIQVGQEATFTVDSFPERRFAAQVAKIRKAPEEVQNVVTYTVVLTARNPDQLLLPGMTASARIVTARKSGILKVPNAALRFRPPEDRIDLAGDTTGSIEGGSTAWLPAPNDPASAVPLALTTGVQDATAVEIIGGPIKEGQRVIVGLGNETESRILGLRFGL
jgi:HlyD family secretion protein